MEKSVRGWRVVDIVVAGVLGLAGGAVFAIWNVAATPLMNVMVPPLSAVYAGVWLFPGVLGGLVVRRPGAALYTEFVAALVSALVGNQWGFATVYYGIGEGLGAELLFALLLYRRWGLDAALLAGAGAGLACGLLDSTVYYASLGVGVRVAYTLVCIVSGAVIAGAGSWLLARALAATGVLASLPSGRAASRV